MIFVEVDVKYPENLHNLHNDLPFLPEGMKIEKEKKKESLLLLYVMKLNMLFT